jgi:hypothetical protein
MKTKTGGIQREMRDDGLCDDPKGTQESQRLTLRQNLLQWQIVFYQPHDLECRLEVHETLTQDRRAKCECYQP